MKKLLASLLVFGVVTSNMVMAVVTPAPKTAPVVTSEIARICNELKAKKAEYAALCTKTPAMEIEKEQLRLDKIACERAITYLHAQLRQALVRVDIQFNSKAYTFGERNPNTTIALEYVVPALAIAIAATAAAGHYTGNGYTFGLATKASGLATKASNWWNAEAIKKEAEIKAEGARLNPGPYPVRTGHGVVDVAKDFAQGALFGLYTPGYKSNWAARNAIYHKWQIEHAPKMVSVVVGA